MRHDTEPFDALYTSTPEDSQMFGAYYIYDPEPFKHGEWRHVATFPKTGGDGQQVEIDECRWPARFYRLRVIAGPNSVGEMRQGFTLSTGSGSVMGKLMVKLAHEIAIGMVSLDEPTAPR